MHIWHFLEGGGFFTREISGRIFYWERMSEGFCSKKFSRGDFSQLNFWEEYLGGMSWRTA